MELYLIRHGESEANAAGRHAGWTPVPLSEKGRRQAGQVGRYLSQINFDRIIVSDVLRARQTAELALPGCAYQLEPRVREINSGILAGQAVKDCIARYGEAYVKAKTELNYAAYQGETDAIVAERVGSFLRDMEKLADNGHTSEKIAVFSHHYAIRQMICYVLGMSYPDKRLLLGNCCVIKLEYSGKEWKVCFVLNWQ